MDFSSLDPKFLTNLLNILTTQTSLGYTRAMPDAMSLMRYFVVFEITIIGIAIALGKSNSHETVWRLVAIAFFLWLIPNWQDVSRQILESFAEAGLRAGGSTMQTVNLFDPSAIVSMGFKAAWSTIKEGFSIWIWKTSASFMAGLAIIIAYFYIALQLFLSIFLFYIISICAIVLLPFSIFKPLSFLGDSAIKATFATGFRLMVLAFILSLSISTLEKLKIDETMIVNPFGLYNILNVAFAAITIAWVAGKVPVIASSFIGGGSIGASDLVGSAISTGLLLSRGASTTDPKPEYNGPYNRRESDKQRIRDAAGK